MTFHFVQQENQVLWCGTGTEEKHQLLILLMLLAKIDQ